MTVSKCRSCGASIRWTKDANTGRGNPLDSEPVPNGNVEVLRGRFGKLRAGTEVPLSRVVAAQESLFGDDLPTRYVSHFVTCPDAESWKRDRSQDTKPTTEENPK